MNYKLSNEENLKIISLYNNDYVTEHKPIALIARENNVTIKFLQHHFFIKNKFNRVKSDRKTWCTYGLNNKKYNHNDTYFSQIDTKNKAYVLGLLITDGWVHTSRNIVGFCLKDSDKYIVEFVRNELSPTKPIRFDTKTNSWWFSMSSKQCVTDLYNLGLEQNKSNKQIKFQFDKIPSKLLSHFIRGVFDGDGCISCRKGEENGRTVSIGMNSSEFLISINELLPEPLHYEYKTEKFMYIRTSRRSVIKSFSNFIYKDAEIYLKRKFDKFLDNTEVTI